MASNYQWELSKLDELSLNERTTSKVIAELESDPSSKEFSDKINTLLHDQISILREKNKHLQEIIRKLETNIKDGYNSPNKECNNSPNKDAKVVNIDRLDDLQDSAMPLGRPSPFYNMASADKHVEIENPEIYGRDLEDYIDKLNDNIELIKKAFNQTAAEFEKPENIARMVESELQNDEEDSSKDTKDHSEMHRKKEKSMFIGGERENENQRRYNSFNSIYRVNVENLEHALENSTFSISVLNKRMKEYPERIKSLEEEIQKMKKEREITNEKIENLMKNENMLKQNINEYNEKMQVLQEKNKVLETEIKEKEMALNGRASTLEQQSNLKEKQFSQPDYYKIAVMQGQGSEDGKPKDEKYLISNKKDCCRIF